ncbi:MAG: transglutaminase family protein [Fimbriimonadaceae bacterium]|nr:transglutaminase family protein [Chthonomonadaceae bacterium]MCO5298006.1 transglutaminase family protein [Fimbriimonadaceae bacterium]
MKKVLAMAVFLVACLASAQDVWLGLYLQGVKVGYASYASRAEKRDGREVTRSDSRTLFNAGLLGQAMSLRMESTSWLAADGSPLAMKFTTSSGGRAQIVDATFGAKAIEVEIDNSGARSHKTLEIPKGARIVDDPIPYLVERASPGATSAFYVLDPTTVSLVKNTATLVGKERTDVKGKPVDATRIDISDPRATLKVFVSAKGDLVKIEGPMGLAMLPLSREEALDGSATGYLPSTDLATSTRIAPDKPLPNPETLTRLKLKITGVDLARIPNDAHQTVVRQGEAWIVETHPVSPRASGAKGSDAGQTAWLKPGLYIPSESAAFRELSRKLTAGRPNTVEAAWSIQDYVHSIMRPDAGIGVLRDASEILRTREGVCRDYAILTATLMRAAKIPARVVAGLVAADGLFYYHAWTEIWDGTNWIGIDATRPRHRVSAAHIKLAQGSVEDAFLFGFLDSVKVEVMEAVGGG